MKRKIPTRELWQRRILAQRASGLAAWAYCRREKICHTSFYLWRKRLGIGKGAEVMATGFMRVRPPALLTGGAMGPNALCIETPNGYRVAASCPDEDGLKNVLELLRCL